MMAGKPLIERCLALTIGIETGRTLPAAYSTLAGNGDGQGLSFGAIQFAWGPGSLGALVQKIDAIDRSSIDDAFADRAASLRAAARLKDRGQRMAWALRTLDGKRVSEPWAKCWRALGQKPACQQAQLDAIKVKYGRGLALCTEYGLTTERGAAMMFDTIVQHGSISNERRRLIRIGYTALRADGTMLEVERLLVIARSLASTVREEHRANVLIRRTCIAEGSGKVHGRDVDLERQYGIGLRPIA